MESRRDLSPKDQESTNKAFNQIDEAIAKYSASHDKKYANQILKEALNDGNLKQTLSRINIVFNATGNNFSIRKTTDQAVIEFNYSEEDYLEAIEYILISTHHLRTDKITHFFDRWPHLKIDDTQFIVGGYLKNKGVVASESKLVAALENQMRREEKTQKSLEKYLGHSNFDLIGFGGSSAIYQDKTGEIAYKVYFPIQKGNEYKEKELENFSFLAETGLPPKLLGEFRDQNGEIAVIGMEKIEIGSLNKLPLEIRKKEADKIIDLALKHFIYLSDTEFVWDQKNQKVRILDLGGISPVDKNNLKEVERWKNELKQRVYNFYFNIETD